MAYYYLIAQLPYLYYEQKPPMTCEDFKTLAKPLMSKDDFEILRNITLNPKDNSVDNPDDPKAKAQNKSAGCSFLDNWYNWDRTLRLELAKQRAVKLKREKPADESGYQVDAVSAASKAMDESSPLDGEILLDKARWNAIDEIAGNNHFHRNSVFAYYLKLLLMERKQTFNAEKGFAEYKSLYASIVDSVQNESVLNAGDQQ